MAKRDRVRQTKTDMVITQKYSPNVFLPKALRSFEMLRNAYPITKRNISEYSKPFVSFNESVLE